MKFAVARMLKGGSRGVGRKFSRGRSGSSMLKRQKTMKLQRQKAIQRQRQNAMQRQKTMEMQRRKTMNSHRRSVEQSKHTRMTLNRKYKTRLEKYKRLQRQRHEMKGNGMNVEQITNTLQSIRESLNDIKETQRIVRNELRKNVEQLRNAETRKYNENGNMVRKKPSSWFSLLGF
jgi:hypothetical protein